MTTKQYPDWKLINNGGPKKDQESMTLCFVRSLLFLNVVLLALFVLSRTRTVAEEITVDSIPVIQWTVQSGTQSLPSSPWQAMEPKTEKWYDSPFYGSKIDWARIGRNWQHPGKDNPTARVFVCERDGQLNISGRVAKLHVDPKTDGVTAMLLHNKEKRWSATIAGGDDKGSECNLTLTVKKGDTIRFVVNPNKNYACDTTLWDPTLFWQDTPDTKYIASKDFSLEKKSDKTPWRYEVHNTYLVTERPLPPDYAENFSAMIEYEWLREDKITAYTGSNFLQSARRHFEAANHLLDNLSDSLEKKDVAVFQSTMKKLGDELKQIKESDSKSCELLYAKIRGLKRKIAFSNPLLDFGKLLFCKRVPSEYSHLVMQYFGWRARRGGGLFILDEPGRSLKCHDITKGKLANGSVLEPRLSWDAKKVVFSWVDMSNNKKYDPRKVHFTDPDEGFYHVWTVDLDGNNLRQITKGSFDDVTPNWLADGDIVYCSTKRKGYARCFWWGFGERWQVYTLHRMAPDGTRDKQLSWHDTNEWFPTVAHNGTIIYARWDYIDRDAVTHQNLWATRPDGTNPLAVWGNATPSPHCTFQARPIPDSQKYVFTASAHHSITGGSLVILNPNAGVDGPQSLKRITPNVPFPETEGWGIPEYYESPFPLSEEYFLTSYSPWPLVMEGGANRENALGIYLYDVFGNRELIYRDPNIGCTTAIPICETPVPPVLPSQLPENAPNTGEMMITDVYQGLGNGVTKGDIRQVRVVQIFPKLTRDADVPPVGLGGEENARAILGCAPVEEDGSAHFQVPAETPIALQVLDKDGNAYQVMRSLTYLQKGEKVSCTGCHENRESSAYSTGDGSESGETKRPKASLRAASKLDPGPWGGRPFSYMETVQPIWDKHCTECHNAKRTEGGFNLTRDPEGAFCKSYVALCVSKQFWGDNGKDPQRAANAWVPRFGGRNTIQKTEPGGHYGARGARLMKLLRSGHEKVALSDSELRDIATWIDLNAVFYGTTDIKEQAIQLKGERIPMPEIQ